MTEFIGFIGAAKFIGQDDAANLLADIPWVAGASTTLSVVGDYLHITTPTSNPRATKNAVGLTVGSTYRLRGAVRVGTSTGVHVRASTTAALSTGDIKQLGPFTVDTDLGSIDNTFVATATSCYIGPVVLATSTTYGEITNDLILELVA